MSMRQKIVSGLFLISLVSLCVSCESSSSSSNDGGSVILNEYELTGTWAGYFLFGDDDKNRNSVSEFDYDADDIFTVGMITLEGQARFVGDVSQFVCLENSLGVYDFGSRKRFSSYDFYLYTWNTDGVSGTGPDDYAATVKSVYLLGDSMLENSFLEGVYSYPPDGDQWLFQLLSYATNVFADVEKLEGEWEINNSFVYGKDGDDEYINTLTLTVDPTSDTAGEITGTDTFGNSISGTIVEIHYSDPSLVIPDTELYDVSLVLSRNIGDPINLDGLATYIESMDSSGISLTQTLAIGATDSARQHLVTGLATKKTTE